MAASAIVPGPAFVMRQVAASIYSEIAEVKPRTCTPPTRRPRAAVTRGGRTAVTRGGLDAHSTRMGAATRGGHVAAATRVDRTWRRSLASAAGGETAATVGEDEAKAEKPMKSPDAEAEALFSRVFRSPLPIPDVSADSKGTRRGRYLSEPQLLGIPNVILYFIFYCLPDDEIEMREIAVGYYELVLL